MPSQGLKSLFAPHFLFKAGFMLSVRTHAAPGAQTSDLHWLMELDCRWKCKCCLQSGCWLTANVLSWALSYAGDHKCFQIKRARHGLHTHLVKVMICGEVVASYKAVDGRHMARIADKEQVALSRGTHKCLCFLSQFALSQEMAWIIRRIHLPKSVAL